MIAMKAVHTKKGSLRKTAKNVLLIHPSALASNYFEIVTFLLQERDCCRVDIVFDQCWPESIKSAERKKRGEGNALEIVINSQSTPVPRQ